VASVEGPDLAQGIQLSAIPDGTMLPGHAQGEAVLLLRRGDDLFAIHAYCTHYSAPLGEGLLVGGYGPLPLASRLLQSTHRRAFLRACAECRLVLACGTRIAPNVYSRIGETVASSTCVKSWTTDRD
jgi:hypothetical protein